MEFTVRPVRNDEIDDALELALKVFMEFEAPVYTDEGIETFKNDVIYNDEFRKKVASGENPMLVALDKNIIIGLICIGRPKHISLLFVDKNYHRIGAATALFSALLLSLPEGTDEITLNASPYGIPFYHKIGFTDVDVQQTANGITFTPMKYKISIFKTKGKA